MAVTFDLAQIDIKACCDRKTGKTGLMADINVSATFKATVGIGVGGDQGIKRLPGKSRPKRGGANVRIRKGRPGAGQFAKNPGEGWGGGGLVTVVVGIKKKLPDCGKTSVSGSFRIEIGGKAGVGLTVNPYANVTIATSDPVNFDYGIRAGVEIYVGAEIYFAATGTGRLHLVHVPGRQRN